MGIILLPPKKYKCSTCGATHWDEYDESPETPFAGHWHVIKCIECGHEKREYIKSIYEEEWGDGTVYSIGYNDFIEF
jgi:hypothetical protein